MTTQGEGVERCPRCKGRGVDPTSGASDIEYAAPEQLCRACGGPGHTTEQPAGAAHAVAHHRRAHQTPDRECEWCEHPDDVYMDDFEWAVKYPMTPEKREWLRSRITSLEAENESLRGSLDEWIADFRSLEAEREAAERGRQQALVAHASESQAKNNMEHRALRAERYLRQTEEARDLHFARIEQLEKALRRVAEDWWLSPRSLRDVARAALSPEYQAEQVKGRDDV